VLVIEEISPKATINREKDEPL